MALAVTGVLTAVAAADTAPKVPVKIILDERRIELAPDASSTLTGQQQMQILESSAIQAFGQQSFGYSETNQVLEITEAYTLKKDGTKIAVAPGAIIDQQRPRSGSATVLSDQKMKVVVYPNVEVGDTTSNTRLLKAKPIIPGLYSYGSAFPNSVEIAKSDLTFVVPKPLSLYFDTKDVTVHKSTSGDNAVYTVHYENHKPVLPGTPYVSLYDRSPYIFASTFKDYDAFAKAYGAVALGKIVVTPKIQAKADEITAGTSDPREQVRKIYEWVTEHVRYVAIEFGQGNIVAHDPEEILVNAYGDCKDHSVVFSALLKAKGIDSDMVVINATDGYTVPSVPVPSVFNHMITYIPSLSLYADTTQRTLPLGYLPPTEYGKTVLHLGTTGKVLRKVPVLSETDSVIAYRETLKLDQDGRVSAEGTFTASGLAGGMARRLGASLNSAGLEKSAAELLSKRGYPGATGTLKLPPATPATADYTISTSWHGENAKMLAGEAFKMTRGMAPESIGGEMTLGPILVEKFKKTDVVACFSNKASEDYTLEIPAGKKIETLPANISVETSELKYSSHWSQKGNAVSVHREFTAHFAEPLCRGSQREGILAAVAKIRADYDTTIKIVSE